MTNNVSRVSVEKPLLGAVLCCTSISPEDRTRLAEYAQQMGAEHKLDLTSDVTHLIVGSTDTPKYAYVAREREDVKVLKPEWVEALRQLWMEDRKLDMNALDAQYRVETFSGLKICITGFDDLAFRSKLADNVKHNGGEYFGDLTKEVTHLVAAAPEGKKYEYATVWGKKIVSLKWYKDTLERGMQLCEDLYHPTIPADQQGLGAWNRKAPQQSALGKRIKDGALAQEPTRKLRRTASAKFSSQADNMWNDIVGGGSHEQEFSRGRDALRPSKSMSAIPQPLPDVPSFHLSLPPESITLNSIKQDPSKYLTGINLTITDFDIGKTRLLHDLLHNLGAQVFEDIADLITDEDVNSANSFIMVPYSTKHSALPNLGRSSIKPTFVSELWLEQCMSRKQLISLQEYPLGGIFNYMKDATRPMNFTINATGFEGIMKLHVRKVILLIGVKYTETFSPECSVLVVNTKPGNTSSAEKLDFARLWRVPVVTEKWLWRFVTLGVLPPLDVPSAPVSAADEDDNDLYQHLRTVRSGKTMQRDHTDVKPRPTSTEPDSSTKETRLPQLASLSPIGAVEDQPTRTIISRVNTESKKASTKSAANGSSGYEGNKKSSVQGPLAEISPNSPTKRPSSRSSNKDFVQVYDGASDLKENMSREVAQTDSMHHSDRKQSASPKPKMDGALAMNNAIQDLLDMKAKARASTSRTDQDAAQKPTKKTLFGRALSNLSNSSRTSNPRQSRASSVDSVNTDGVGSELATASGRSNTHQDDKADIANSRNQSIALKGRARRESSILNVAPPPVDLSDPNLCRDTFADDDTPQLTQLGYEDSEEAIALREKLAEKRRARGKLGQETADDSSSILPTKSRDEGKGKNKRAEKQVIRDDETMLALQNDLGWGGRRRLRERKKGDDNDDMAGMVF